MINRKWFALAVCGALLMFFGARNAQALTTIDGTLWAGLSKYLVTGSAVNVTANAVLKITFETTTAGDNLELCAGTNFDFAAGVCATRLNDSGGPGYVFLTIVDAASLNGKQIYVIRAVGTNAASFHFTIE